MTVSTNSATQFSIQNESDELNVLLHFSVAGSIFYQFSIGSINSINTSPKSCSEEIKLFPRELATNVWSILIFSSRYLYPNFQLLSTSRNWKEVISLIFWLQLKCWTRVPKNLSTASINCEKGPNGSHRQIVSGSCKHCLAFSSNQFLQSTVKLVDLRALHEEFAMKKRAISSCMPVCSQCNERNKNNWCFPGMAWRTDFVVSRTIKTVWLRKWIGFLLPIRCETSKAGFSRVPTIDTIYFQWNWSLWDSLYSCFRP